MQRITIARTQPLRNMQMHSRSVVLAPVSRGPKRLVTVAVRSQGGIGGLLTSLRKALGRMFTQAPPSASVQRQTHGEQASFMQQQQRKDETYLDGAVKGVMQGNFDRRETEPGASTPPTLPKRGGTAVEGWKGEIHHKGKEGFHSETR